MFFDKHNIFRNTPKLVNLDLSGNMFDLSTDVLHQIILSIPLLRTLRLNDCTLKSLPTHIIYKIPTLRFMSVNQNQISSWNGYEVFGNRTTLSALISRNRILAIMMKTIPNTDNDVTTTRNTSLSLQAASDGK
jgi:Leucine-rich repeat (LRR) protein